LIKNHAVSN